MYVYILSFIKTEDVQNANWAWASSCLETRTRTLLEVFASSLSSRHKSLSASFVPAVSMGMMEKEGRKWVSARQARVTQHSIVA